MRPHITALLHNRFIQRHEPFSVVHFVTTRCNARCKHCFIDFSTPIDRANELALDEIVRLARNLGKTLYNVNLTGGEPFLRDDLFDIVSCYIQHTPVRSIVITTNGWFTDAIRTLLKRYSRLDTPCSLTISISIDNIEQKHDSGRQLAGLYAHAIESYRAVAACKDPRINADIALTVTPENADTITEIYHRLQQTGINTVSPIMLREEGVQNSIANKQKLASAYRELTRLTEETGSAAPGEFTRALHRAKKRISHRILHDSCLNPRFISPCKAGSLFVTITADGTVAPCELLTERMPLGNLRDYEMNFLKLLNSQRAQNARHEISKTKCHCTFECAWTVNILTTPSYWPSLALNTLKELT